MRVLTKDAYDEYDNDWTVTIYVEYNVSIFLYKYVAKNFPPCFNKLRFYIYRRSKKGMSILWTNKDSRAIGIRSQGTS